MFLTNKKTLLLCLVLWTSILSSSAQNTPYSIVPQPQEMTLRPGVFELNNKVEIVSSTECFQEATLFIQWLNKATGENFTVKKMEEWSYSGPYILFKSKASAAAHPDLKNMPYLNPKYAALDESTSHEGYSMTIEERGITITSEIPAGIFYATQSLRQMLPANAELQKLRLPFTFSCVQIKDKPAFVHRGMLLDCCRHFMTPDFVKRYIDLLSYYKMNVLHWHLTEDQGWRIQIDKYPLLTSVGGYRTEDDGTVYGGFYTKEQIKDIVKYASERHITIIPEIELPGHSVAAIAAYPWLSCTGDTIPVENEWGVFKDIYCAGSEQTFEFMEDIMDEVCELFPGPYIHIGGDEAPKYRWEHCDKCQKRIHDEHLKNEAELQTYFIERVAKYLETKNKKIIGWDEILEGGIPEGSMIQSWRGMEGGIAAAKSKHGVVMSPTSHCYFDYGLENIDLEKVYSFNPIPEELKTNGKEFIKGAECNMWTERAPQEVVDQRIFPRMPALAEVLWSYNENRQFIEFESRLKKHYPIWDAMGVKYGFAKVPVQFTPAIDKNGKMTLSISPSPSDMKLQYSTGEKIAFKPYADPISITEPTVVKVKATSPTGQEYPIIFEKSLNPHKAIGIKPKLNYTPSPYYTGGGEMAVTDGVVGSSNFRDGHWQAQQGKDFEIILDLKTEQTFGALETHFFHYANAWIFRPEYVIFETSNEGQNWTLLEKVITTVAPETKGEFPVNYTTTNTSKISARYIRVTAKSIGPCPTWHDAVGEPSWLFIDEILVTSY